MNQKRVVLAVEGRFHFFHLARQLERRGWLQGIYTTYPPFKLRDEGEIPTNKIHCHWLYQTTWVALARFGVPVHRLHWLQNLTRKSFDQWMRKMLPESDAFVALSGSGLAAGPIAQQRGGKWLCERGSTHILYQTRVLQEQYQMYGEEFRATSKETIDRECEEYAMADHIVVPSNFVKRTFIQEGIPASRISVASYGADLFRFRANGTPPTHEFVVLFIGHFSIRKGAPYLIEAFQRFSHPNKRLRIIGSVDPVVQRLVSSKLPTTVEFVGIVPNRELALHYSTAHAFVLPSIEEGLALVMGEALACGCPVIATPNTGAEDLFDDGIEGFVVPACDAGAIADRLQEIADEPELRAKMSAAALERVKSIGGWDSYGGAYERILNSLLA
jgi:alpha-maltose-1-phosphate synthase